MTEEDQRRESNDIVAEILRRRMNRRRALTTAAKVGLAAGVAAVAAGGGAAAFFATQPRAPATTVTLTQTGTVTQTATTPTVRPRPTTPLQFDIWAFRPDLVQISVDEFSQQMNENVGLTTVTADYFAVLETKLLGGDLDMAYTTPDFAHRMYGAGLTRDLNDVERSEFSLWSADEIKQAQIDSGFKSFVDTYTSLDGAYIGMPYYQSVLGALHGNELLLEKAGLKDSPPEDYAELYKNIEDIKKQGVADPPFVPLWYQAFPGWGISQGFVSEVINRGGVNALFKSAPTFEVNFDTNTVAADVLKDWKWLWDKELVPRSIISVSTDSDVDGLFATGQYAYIRWWLYLVRGWNDPKFSKIAGFSSVMPPIKNGWGYAVQQGYLVRDIKDNPELRKRTEGLATWFAYKDRGGRYNHELRIGAYGGIAAHTAYAEANTSLELLEAWKPFLYKPETDLQTMNEVLKQAAWFEALRAPWSNEWMIELTDKLPQFLTGTITLEQTITAFREKAFELQKKYQT